MIILTSHAKKRIKERYYGTEFEFLKEIKEVLKGISKKKISNYTKIEGDFGKVKIFYLFHKIVYVKEGGDYRIITYGRRNIKLR